MTKEAGKLANISTVDLLKELRKAEGQLSGLRFELHAGKKAAHKEYLLSKKNVARIKTELAKRAKSM